MKNIYKLLLVMFCLTICSISLKAQWVPTNGPFGATIKSTAISTDIFFVGTSNSGIFRSTDNGVCWTAVNNGLTETTIEAIAITDSCVFAATSGLYSNGGRLFRSKDNGNNWQLLNPGFGNILTLSVIGKNIFAGTGGGIYRSADGGNSWTQTCNYIGVFTIVSKGTCIYAGTNNGYTISSTDEGLNWTPTFIESTGISNPYSLVLSMAATNNEVFAGTYRGLYRLSEVGNYWILVRPGRVNSVAVSGNRVFVGTDTEGICYSSDNGATWASANNGLPLIEITKIAGSGNTIYAGTCGAGIFKSSDFGENWLAINSGLTDISTTSFAIVNNTIFSATDNVGIFRFNDSDNSWITSNNGLLNFNVITMFANDNKIFAGTLGGLFSSIDNGISWISSNSGLSPYFVLDMTICNNFIFATTNGGKCFRSYDNGNNWVFAYNSLPACFRHIAVNGTLIYVDANNGGGLYRSSDYGNNWVEINNGLTDKYITGLVVAGTKIFAATTNGLFCSSDNGDSWGAVNDGIPGGSNGIRMINAITAVDSFVFAAKKSKIYATKIDNIYWKEVSTGLEISNISKIAVCGNNLFAGGYGGPIWKRPITEMTSISNSEISTDFILQQNYPNPFNSSTIISYQLSVRSHVKLNIYNAQGQLVKELFNGQQAVGNHSVKFNAAGLNSGVYYYKLETNRQSVVNKMILVK